MGTDGTVVGYVSGVWDMFHIGHLNIIMRARERCDRLVVGVVTDEVVVAMKGHAPVIPVAERLDIVRGLRDVDDVLVDPYVDRVDSWRHLVRFDVLFKGDDWAGTPRGESLARRLAEVGARMEFFPYTAHTSSSLLRDVLTRLANTPVEPVALDERPTPLAPAAVTAQAAASNDVRSALDPAAARSAARRCPSCGQAVGRAERAPASTQFRSRVHLES